MVASLGLWCSPGQPSRMRTRRIKKGSDVSDEKRDLIEENKRLSEEAKRAVLQAIITEAPNAGLNRIEELARAYALVVGAKWGILPGGSLSVDSK